MDPATNKRPKLSEGSASNLMRLQNICEGRESKAIAVKYHGLHESFKIITYEEVYADCVSIANTLRGLTGSQFIGIDSEIPAYCLPTIMLGIMSSGRAFVCLESSAPGSKRISAKLNISQVFLYGKIREAGVIEDFTVGSEKIFLARLNETSLDPQDFYLREKAQGLFAYATTTSGTTGEPKIVRVTHRSIVPNILDLKKILNVSEKDIIAQITPLTFDPSMIEIFLSLSCGATLLMFSQELKNDSELLLQTIVKNRVSILQSTPSLLLQRWPNEKLRESLLSKDTGLRILLLGGEDLPRENILSKIRSFDNETRIFDIYGITEVSCWATIREIEKHDFTRSLGKTMSETMLEVRNEEGIRIHDGEGFLYIGSNSRICVIDDEDIEILDTPVFRETGDVAVINQDGEISLKGRRDRRVKRYGTKLYLADLEKHVEELSFVENSYASFTADNQSLHLYFTIFKKSIGESDKKNYENEVSNHVIELSNVYRPDKITMLTRFELTKNGKICTNFLKKYSAQPLRFIENNEENLEAAKAFENIWKRSLPPDDESRFLNSGGTSVMALRIANELKDKTGNEFPKLMGLLLGNENFKACREYISKEILNSPQTPRNFVDPEKSPQDKSSEIFDQSSGKSKTIESDDYSQRLIENITEKTFPFQKCRGRSTFPVAKNSKDEKTWNKSTNIRLQNRYNLAKCVDASPTIFSYPGGKNYVTVGSHAGIICTAELTKENVAECWEISLPNRIEASILVVDDFRGIVGSYDTFVYCFHLKTGEIFWKFKTNDIVKCSAVLCSRKKTVFFGSYDRQIYCVSLEDGSKVWKVKAGNGSICATPCISNKSNCVLFASLDGTCVSLKQENGGINWLKKFDYPVFSAPIIMDEDGPAVFCDVSGELHFLSLETGQEMRSWKIDGNVFSHLYVHTNLETRVQSVLFGSENKNIYKMEYRSGGTSPILRFAKDIESPITSTPFSDGEVIVVAGINGNLKILDFTEAEILCNFKLGGEVFSSPLIHGDFIVVGCRDNHLYILSR